MKNVYDILVNFKTVPYEFYEWNTDDDIKHIKKICSIKVSDDTIKDIIENDCFVSKKFLEQIKCKTEVFYNRMVKIIEYACVIFNDDLALAIILDKNGYIIGKSKLLFDESDDVILNGKDLSVSTIKYNIIKKTDNNLKYTRNENKMISLINKYLEKIYKQEEKEELKYVYFECYNKTEEDIKKIYDKLKESISSADFNIINRLKTLIKVLKK